MIVRQQEDDLIRSPPEVIDHSHSAALAAFSARNSPTELSASRRTDNDVPSRWVNQQIFLHPLVVLIFKEIGDEFGKHRRLNEGEFH